MSYQSQINYNIWSTNFEGQRFDKLSNLFNIVVDLISNNDDDCNKMIEMTNDMKNKLMPSESIGRIYKSLNMSNNSIINHEIVDGTSKEGNKKILTLRVVHSK